MWKACHTLQGLSGARTPDWCLKKSFLREMVSGNQQQVFECLFNGHMTSQMGHLQCEHQVHCVRGKMKLFLDTNGHILKLC